VSSDKVRISFTFNMSFTSNMSFKGSFSVQLDTDEEVPQRPYDGPITRSRAKDLEEEESL